MLSRRRDRAKTGKDSHSRKDEPDAATPISAHLSLHTEKNEDPFRTADCMASLQQPYMTGRGVHLNLESGSSESGVADSKTSVHELLIRLEEKIDSSMAKAGLHESNDMMEVHSEMKKLLRATIKQKEDFNQLLDTVKRQKQILKKLESSARSGKLGLQTFEGPEKELGSAIQCTQDHEGHDRESDRNIVLLIRGNHEFSRKMSQCGCDYDPLNSADIPDDINQGNRMLAGQRDYPQLLLDSSVVNRFVDSRSGQDPGRIPEPRRPPENGGLGNLYKTCPICQQRFEANDTDALMAHVDTHFES